jgi:GxxExxY protein
MPYEEEQAPYSNLTEPPPELDQLAKQVIGAAIEVHRELGPGLPEQAYQGAMEIELKKRSIPFQRQCTITVAYKGAPAAKGCIDLLIDGKLIVEIKSLDELAPVHRLQVRTYMRIIKQPLGLLINFNVPILKEGIRRIIETKN